MNMDNRILVHRNGFVFQMPASPLCSRRYTAHPDGAGTSWTLSEGIDVDQPHGLDFRALCHLAKAVRKRNDKEHVGYDDLTVGGEHVPGWCKVLKHVDTTVDVSGAADATLFQYNGIVHSMGNQTLWCITGAAGDPTVLLIHPNRQWKAGCITWSSGAEFDASVDMTGPLHVDGSVLFDGPMCVTDTLIDGTLDVYDRADFSSAGFSGDVTLAAAAQVDGTLNINGVTRIVGDVTMSGLMSFCGNNVYDSSWFACELGAAYTKTHDLSSTALLISTYFKDSANGFVLGVNRVYHVSYQSDGDSEFGCNVGNITTTQLTVQGGANRVAVAFNGTGGQVGCNSGHYRVIAMRLV